MGLRDSVGVFNLGLRMRRLFIVTKSMKNNTAVIPAKTVLRESTVPTMRIMAAGMLRQRSANPDTKTKAWMALPIGLSHKDLVGVIAGAGVLVGSGAAREELDRMGRSIKECV